MIDYNVACSTGAAQRSEMKSPMTMDELRELLNVTEECLTRAVSAQQKAAKYLDHYRIQLEEYKRQAARATSPEVRESLLRIAASYERLVRSAERAESLRSEPADGPQEMRNAAAYEEEVLRQKPAEDPIAQARRHVVEARGHIARQEALVARLASDNRHAALAPEARAILVTLKQTLSLAQQHLDLELKK
jgi:hypothetical protein